MKHIAQEEILSAVLIQDEPSAVLAMTKREKLERWADLISQHNSVSMIHGLEFWSPAMLDCFLWDILGDRWVSTPFAIAACDPVFKEMGLICTINNTMQFFNLTKEELHDFTCDCGGQINGWSMARRIRNLADPTFLGWCRNWFKA